MTCVDWCCDVVTCVVDVVVLNIMCCCCCDLRCWC